MAQVKKAVIPAAGRATRQYPASTAVQKAFFPIVDRDGLAKPVIQLLLEESLDSGIEEICIITQPGDDKIYRDYFRALSPEQARHYQNRDWAMVESEKLAKIGARLHFATQPSAEGFGHAVYQAKSFAGNDPFLLLLGDHVFLSDTIDRCARQLMNAFEQNNLDAATAVTISPERDLAGFGTIRGNPIDVERGLFKAELIIEKPSIEEARQKLTTPQIPAGNYLCHFGQHIFSPRLFDSLEYLIKNNLRQNGEIQLTAAQEHLRQQTNNYYAVVIRGQRYDTGIPYGFMETQIALGLNGIHRTEISQAIARILASQNRL